MGKLSWIFRPNRNVGRILGVVSDGHIRYWICLHDIDINGETFEAIGPTNNKPIAIGSLKKCMRAVRLHHIRYQRWINS